MALSLSFPSPNLAPVRISPAMLPAPAWGPRMVLLRRKGVDVGGGGGFRVMGSAVTRQFSAPARSRSDEKKRGEYYVNTGHAIRTLREEMPALFYKEPTFDIYRDDIAFKDPVNTFMGVENYKMMFWALRVNGKVFFRALSFDIVSVWQPADNSVMLRWTVHGIPRGPWDNHGRFDGTSEYKFDKDGKIYEHKVDNVAHNSTPKYHVLSVEALIQSLGCPSTPKATYFELSTPLFRELAVSDDQSKSKSRSIGTS